MTDRDKLIEAMARALCLLSPNDPDAISSNDGPYWGYYVPQAQAALAAIEAQGLAVVPVEPTDALLCAAEDFITLRGIWDAMIRAARDGV